MLSETLTNLALSDLRLGLSVDRQAARLTAGQVLIQGQRISFTGELPLDRNSWSELAHKKAPDWTKASGQLRIDNAPSSRHVSAAWLIAQTSDVKVVFPRPPRRGAT